MRKYWILFILIPFITMFSCMDDTSAYLPQERENVNVDEVVVDTTNGDTILPEGQLVPGMHLVKLMIQQGDGLVERRFKYFMPVTLNPDRPISLIFVIRLMGRMKLRIRLRIFRKEISCVRRRSRRILSSVIRPDRWKFPMRLIPAVR